MIAQAARKAGVPLALYQALVGRESGGRVGAISHAGAQGPSQLMPGTARALEQRHGINTRTPLGNLLGGAFYLREQLDRFKRPDLALSAYNSGPGGAESSGRVEGFSETQAYVKNVLADAKRLGLGAGGAGLRTQDGTADEGGAMRVRHAPLDAPRSANAGNARKEMLLSLLAQRRSGSSDRSPVLAALSQLRAPKPPPTGEGPALASSRPPRQPPANGPEQGRRQGGIDDAFYTPLGASVDEGRYVDGFTIPNHDGHGHVSFQDAASARRILAEAARRGLRVGENPAYDKVDPVHVKNSDHYQTFEGTNLGRAADLSGDPKVLEAFMRWVMGQAGKR